MGSCHIGPTFPAWLRSQESLDSLDLSNASISTSIPNWFWNISSNTRFLILSGNQITGSISDSIGRLTSLELIDFSSNHLVGSIPFAINNCSALNVLNLGNNNLSEIIPESLGQLQSLKSLHLNHNKLFGELPSSLQNLTSLDVLDLSYNKLSGQVPAWVGTAFVNLVILNLRSNIFFGRLPSQISNLSSLHVLDLAHNNLMDEIPTTLAQLKGMTHKNGTGLYSLYDISKYSPIDYRIRSGYEERLVVIGKGMSLEYTRTLSLVVSIDLSHNNFSGGIPEGITNLIGLVLLNLSMNHITGQIPESISKLQQLNSLDLSRNYLFGPIPSSMSLLSSLGYLNLSSNNFSGKIPFTGHMSTFTESAFAGNPNICGTPLWVKCPEDEDSDTRQSGVVDKIDGSYVDEWFYLSIGLGFATGILVPYLVMAMRRSWCKVYFDFVDKIVKWLLVRRRARATIARNHAPRR